MDEDPPFSPFEKGLISLVDSKTNSLVDGEITVPATKDAVDMVDDLVAVAVVVGVINCSILSSVCSVCVSNGICCGRSLVAQRYKSSVFSVQSATNRTNGRISPSLAICKYL